MSKLISKDDYFRLHAEYFLVSPVQAKGDIETEDDVYIDCEYQGQITSSGLVDIAKNAVFTGDIKARSCIVSGKLSGNIYAKEDVVIFKSATIDANIDTNELEIERGANFRGKITMKAVL